MWLDVHEDFSKLSKSEQLALFEALKHDLFPEELDKINKLLKILREARFSSGIGCVHCDSTEVKRNGKYRSRQRYLCKDSRKSLMI